MIKKFNYFKIHQSINNLHLYINKACANSNKCCIVKKQYCNQKGSTMSFVCRTDEELKERGQSILITRAIELIGGAGVAAKKLGLTNPQTVKSWMRKERKIPVGYLNPISKLGGGKIKPQQMLDEMDSWK
jgi:DNA-binding transcriptional regulator YdaS (Cro superfamily)